MTIKIDVSVDDNNIRRRLNGLQKYLDAGVHSDVEIAGRLLRDLVKRDMPKDTTLSAKSIMVSARKFQTGSELRLGLSFKPHPEKTFKGEWFNLPRFMFMADRGTVLKHFAKSGNVASMRDAPEYVFSKLGVRINKELNKILKR